MANNQFLTRPQIIGDIQESYLYSLMGIGFTDPILFIGHADALTMYEPYQVTDIKKAIRFLQADPNSPLLRAMMEAYNAGSKDIWLYPAAPMSEYEPFMNLRMNSRADWDNKNFYERYYDRLTAAYPRLQDRDAYRVVTPLEAPHYYTGYNSTTGKDFTGQLVDFCETFFSNTGSICLGLIGTRIGDFSSDMINEITTDPRLSSPSLSSKLVMIVLGETLNYVQQIGSSYSSSASTQAAIAMTLMPMNESVVGIKFPASSSLAGRNFSDEEIAILAANKINPAIRSKKGKRGQPYEISMITDHTLAADGSNYWSMTQMRAIASCLNKIRDIGFQFIGELHGFERLRQAIDSYLRILTSQKMIHAYSFSMRSSINNLTAYVDVVIRPVFSLKNVYFTVEIGPGE